MHEKRVLTKDDLNAMIPPQTDLPSYTVVELVNLVIEFKKTHPETMYCEEWFDFPSVMEARGAFNFLAWLAAGKTFPEKDGDELEELLKDD